MCTCFVNKGNDLIIGMNFDNNGMKYRLRTNSAEDFVMYVDPGTGIGLVPSFGIKNGIFFNSLYCDSNGKGLYKRSNSKRIHNGKIFNDIFKEKINLLEYYNYLKNIEVVNGPNASIHCLLADFDGNSLLIEQGRGNVYYPNTETQNFVMANFSIIDYNNSKKYDDHGFDRYTKAKDYLDKKNNFSVKDAFAILENVKQNNEWKTDFSFVYSRNEKKVFYWNAIVVHTPRLGMYAVPWKNV